MRWRLIETELAEDSCFPLSSYCQTNIPLREGAICESVYPLSIDHKAKLRTLRQQVQIIGMLETLGNKKELFFCEG